ncbi:MAG: hypothetical protein AAF587_37715 [Bacteroidota bacterium]
MLITLIIMSAKHKQLGKGPHRKKDVNSSSEEAKKILKEACKYWPKECWDALSLFMKNEDLSDPIEALETIIKELDKHVKPRIIQRE